MQVAPRPHPPHHSYSQAYPMDHLQTASAQQTHQPQSHAAAQRKRKRQGLNGSQVSYRSEYESDRFGEMREYIVIEDTPPPDQLSSSNLPPGLAPTPSQASSVATNGKPKTRLQAQIAAAASGSQPLGPASSAESCGTFNAPPTKRRKRDTVDDATPVAQNGAIAGPSTGAHARKAIAGRAYESQQLKPYPSGANWMNAGSGGGTESVRASQVSVASTQIQTPITPSYDDKDGYYIITPGDLVKDRYQIVRLLGQGTFGKVVEATDILNRSKVAVKIIRAIPKYRDASKIEMRVLKTLRERDPDNMNKCIHMLDSFDHRNHICIVTELLGLCLYDFLKENEFQPFPRLHIQDFARQLLTSVAYLHRLTLIHTDLKPENILLVNHDFKSVAVPPAPGSRSKSMRQKRVLMQTDVRLIDFGSATFEEEYHPTVVSTRHYRAPEIILGLGWSFPCDAFSIGCILAEFFTGQALFQTHDNLEHLAMMEVVMGKMPTSLTRRGVRTKAEFFKTPSGSATPILDYPRAKSTRQSRKEVNKAKSLLDIIGERDAINSQFLDLVKQLLAWEPSERLTVQAALNHPYFEIHIPPEYNS